MREEDDRIAVPVLRTQPTPAVAHRRDLLRVALDPAHGIEGKRLERVSTVYSDSSRKRTTSNWSAPTAAKIGSRRPLADRVKELDRALFLDLASAP